MFDRRSFVLGLQNKMKQNMLPGADPLMDILTSTGIDPRQQANNNPMGGGMPPMGGGMPQQGNQQQEKIFGFGVDKNYIETHKKRAEQGFTPYMAITQSKGKERAMELQNLAGMFGQVAPLPVANPENPTMKQFRQYSQTRMQELKQANDQRSNSLRAIYDRRRNQQPGMMGGAPVGYPENDYDSGMIGEAAEPPSLDFSAATIKPNYTSTPDNPIINIGSNSNTQTYVDTNTNGLGFQVDPYFLKFIMTNREDDTQSPYVSLSSYRGRERTRDVNNAATRSGSSVGRNSLYGTVDNEMLERGLDTDYAFSADTTQARNKNFSNLIDRWHPNGKFQSKFRSR